MVKDRLAQLKANAKAEGWCRYITTAADECAMLDGCWVDVRLGQHVCNYFAKRLVHTKPAQWAGQPFELVEWQKHDLIIPLFSWVRPDGRRRFTEAGIWLAKKQGKSPLAAGLLLYGADPNGDEEDGAECYSMSNVREQASITYRFALGMVQASPYLSKVFKQLPSQKRLTAGSQTWIQALSADAGHQHGILPHFMVVDEVHSFNEEGRDRISANRYGMRVRQKPMTIYISSAGDDNSGIGREEYERHKRVLQGFTDDLSLFAYIREADKGDDWTSPITWRKANPMLGITFQESDMARECATAKTSTTAQADFRRYCLNQWVGASEPWLSVEKWASAGRTISDAELVGLPCVGGFDLSERSDLTAWVKLFKARDGKTILIPHFWLPLESIDELERKDSCPYQRWADAGWITLCDGPSINYSMVQERIAADARKYRIKRIGYDRYQASMIRDELSAKSGLTLIEIAQTFQGMSEPSKEFESLIVSGMIEHDENPIMSRMISQVTTMCDTNGNIRPTKRDKKKRKKIDGVVAAIMALRVQMASSPKASSGGVLWV